MDKVSASFNKLNEVSIEEAKKFLISIIIKGFKSGKPPTNICLHGSPGIGKSAITNALPCDLSPILGVPEDQIVVIDVRLAAMQESDVQGIPFVCGEDMKFSTPSWFPKDDGRYYILFFDELMNCSRPVQHAAYRVILDRSIQNGSVLPKRCAIIGAGNLKSDKTGAQPLLPAAANRFGMHLNLTKIHQSFLNYMVNNNFDPTIVGFLEWNKDAIYKAPEDEAAFPTPRTWENVNEHLDNGDIVSDDSTLTTAVASAIGSVYATEYMAFREYYGVLPNWARIRNGDVSYKYNVPKDDPAIACALSTSIAFELIECLENGYADQIENLCNVIVKDLPKETIVTMIRTLKRNPKCVAKLVQHPSLYAAFKRVSTHV